MPRKNLKISNEELKSLEEKITKHLLNKIETFVTEKCKKFFQENQHNVLEEPSVLQEEISQLKLSLISLQNDFRKLSDKTDHTIGGLSYIASEYDDFNERINSLSNKNEIFKKDIIRLNELYDKLDKNQSKIEVQLEELDQYGRRENLEVHGIPWSQNENTNAIVKKVAESLKVKLDDKDISTSHRLYPNNKVIDNRPSKRQNADQFAYKNSTQTKAELNLDEHSPIIVRFSNRDKRNELFAKRRTLKSSVNSTSTDNQNTMSINFTLRENLTKYRKMLFNEAKKFKLSMKYQFLWTWQGQIMIRKTERSKIWKISSLRDLANIQKFAGGETSFV